LADHPTNVYDRFRDPEGARALLAQVRALAEALPPSPDGRYQLMEVCGTHTHAIARLGLRQLLPPVVRLLSGPGCPVCVTPTGDVDLALELAGRSGVIVATFGDMIRVPGSEHTLADVRAQGARVEVVYSPMAALDLAAANPDSQVVFLGVGFETTAPAIAGTVVVAHERQVPNFTVLCSHKLIPPAMEALLSDAAGGAARVRLDGFLCPGHVSAVIGAAAYVPVAERFHIPCVVAGFEPLDILRAVHALLRQIAEGRAEVENAYERTVRWEGNPKARAVIERVFEVGESEWRGIGPIPGSGLQFRPEYAAFDAAQRFGLERRPGRDHAACHCGEVLRGLIDPPECRAFREACTPDRPLGPCMVSSEGACSAWYKHPTLGR